MGLENPAQMGGGDRDQVFGDFPQGKLAQPFLAVRRIPPFRQIIAAPGTKGGGFGESGGIDAGTEFTCRAGRINVLITGRGESGFLLIPLRMCAVLGQMR